MPCSSRFHPNRPNPSHRPNRPSHATGMRVRVSGWRSHEHWHGCHCDSQVIVIGVVVVVVGVMVVVVGVVIVVVSSMVSPMPAAMSPPVPTVVAAAMMSAAVSAAGFGRRRHRAQQDPATDCHCHQGSREHRHDCLPVSGSCFRVSFSSPITPAKAEKGGGHGRNDFAWRGWLFPRRFLVQKGAQGTS